MKHEKCGCVGVSFNLRKPAKLRARHHQKDCLQLLYVLYMQNVALQKTHEDRLDSDGSLSFLRFQFLPTWAQRHTIPEMGSADKAFWRLARIEHSSAEAREKGTEGDSFGVLELNHPIALAHNPNPSQL
jgi:hypothetical protein